MSGDPITEFVAAAANVLQIIEGHEGRLLDVNRLRASQCYQEVLAGVRRLQSASADGEAKLPPFQVVEGGKPC